MTDRDRDAAIANVLAATSLFADAGVDAVDLRALAHAGVRKQLRKRQRLFARGERGDALAIVLVGRLDVVRGDVTLRSLPAGAVVGLSTVAGAAHSADVVAAEASTSVLVLQGRDLRPLFAKRPELPLLMLQALARLVADLSDDVEALRGEDIEERARRKLEQVLRDRHDVAMTHADLARLIGATRANTSRALASLERRGIVRRRRGLLSFFSR